MDIYLYIFWMEINAILTESKAQPDVHDVYQS